MKDLNVKPFIEDEIYPLTIVSDRYSGTYSGGDYTAWNLFYNDLPSEIDSDDVSCYEFWNSEKCKEYVVGKGMTVSLALLDLYLKLKGETE